jgi:hypothetical protein
VDHFCRTAFSYCLMHTLVSSRADGLSVLNPSNTELCPVHVQMGLPHGCIHRLVPIKTTYLTPTCQTGEHVHLQRSLLHDIGWEVPPSCNGTRLKMANQFAIIARLESVSSPHCYIWIVRHANRYVLYVG